ncbi:MAG: polysaccharide biosynthesis tyrosine autokinase [Gemmatimonadota bacterium]|jgi:capsular exopolysaccharide synthesis family protein|nr:polysaccharide biosynthesis tyrosine autokinase [Gemmatimonadota bacterium]
MALSSRTNHPFLSIHEPGSASPPPFFPREERTISARASAALRAIIRRWWLIPIFAALTTAAGWFLVPTSEGLREATAIVRVANPRPPGAEDMGLSDEVIDVTAMLAQARIVTSEPVVDQVVDSHQLRFWTSPGLPLYLLKDVEIKAGIGATDNLSFAFRDASWSVRSTAVGTVDGRYGVPVEIGGVTLTIEARPPGIDSASASLLSKREVIDLVSSRLEAWARGEAGIMDITYRDANEDRAIQVVNAITRAYVEYSYRMSGAGGQARAEILEVEQQLAEAEAEVLRIQELLATYQSPGVEVTSPSPSADQATIASLQDRLRRLNTQRRLLTDFTTRVQGTGPDQVDAAITTLMVAPGMSSNPRFTQLQSTLDARRLEYAWLRAEGYTESSVEVMGIGASIAATRGMVIRAATDELTAVNREITSVNARLSGTAATASPAPVANGITRGEEAFLQQELAAAQAEVSAVRNQYQLVRMGTGGPGSTEILELANFTGEASALSRLMVLGLSLLVGVVLGSGGALALEARDPSVRSRSEMEALLQAPGLAIVPKIPSGQRDVATPNDLRSYSPALTGIGGPMSVSPELRQFHSLAAEAYRMLRTNLIFLRTGQALRSIVVTSAGMGDGKTTTAVNLAVAFARQGQRVILVDCDLRRPRLHTFFDMDVGPGLVEVILGAEMPDRVIRPTPIENLSLLSRGAFDERASELLSGARGHRIIQSLAERCDILIFDSSPTLLTADASAVAPYTDGVLFVARAGRTPREAARQAGAQLRVVGANLLGFVLNDPEAIAEQYGEGKYSKEYYSVEV